jgi:multidrug efflux pump subunit AcrA (membrane-fusion protein)
MKKTLLLKTILIITLLVFSGCERIKETYGKFQNSRTAPGAPPGGQAQMAQIFAVNSSTTVNGQIQDYLALSGDIIASSTVDTYSDAAGKVSRLYVSVGSQVKRGDPVAAVDPSRPGMDFIPSIVRAPVAGTIIALPAQLGMTVSQAVPLARISGGAGLEIKLHVAERFISKVSMNQPCEITLDAYPGEIFRGSITEVSPTVDTVSRTMEIRVGVENPGSRLKAGMFAKVRIITEKKDNIVKIPASAVVNRFGEQYVFSIDKTDPEAPVARKRTIIPGILIDGVMEIRDGLSPDEEIVIRGQTLLEDGSRVNIIEQLSPLSAN